MSALLLALAVQDGWTWKFEFKLDKVKKAARVVERIGRDYDRDRLTWQRAAMHAWAEMDRKDATRLYFSTLRALPPDARERFFEFQAWLIKRATGFGAGEPRSRRSNLPSRKTDRKAQNSRQKK
jgi:hypothetical protein